MSKKVKRSYMLTVDADELLRKLAELNGVNMTAIIELAIRQMAKDQGVATAPDSDATVGPV